MSILFLILFLVVICLILYGINQTIPELLTPQANRLIWVVITVVVLVLLLVWVLQVFGLSVGGIANWGPRLGTR